MKASLYGETGVPEYWVADITNDCVWAYSDIQERHYQTCLQFRRLESIVPQLLPGCPIPVDILLP